MSTSDSELHAVDHTIIEHAIDRRVPYVECDAMGVVHHSHYATWFELARTELLRRQGVAYSECEQRGLFIVVARLNVRYHRPARYDQIVRITATLRRATGARIEHDYTVHHDTELLCTGSTVLACTDTTGRIIPIPDFLRNDA